MKTFEIPYNFDINLIKTLQIFDPKGTTINCIYLPPFIKDYQTILRSGEQAAYLDSLTFKDYEQHINIINTIYPNKLQLLLQHPNNIMNENNIKKYIKLGFRKFCVNSIEQAKIIKKIDNNLEIIGSISILISKEKLESNIDYGYYFDSFVLPFSFCKDFQAIEQLPKYYKYILLINAFCHVQCNGIQHWWYNYKPSNEENFCPGLYGVNDNVKWKDTTLIRPMDLTIFDPYISVYKLQDRGWPTDLILRDYILYTSNYESYPGIEYNKNFYIKD